MRHLTPRHLFTLLALVAGCAQATRGDDSDRQDNTLDGVTQQPHAAVCSGPIKCFARIRTDESNHIQNYASPQGYGPTDLASAYNLTGTASSTLTIAIVDAYNYANAESDLAKYRAQYLLPACTTANGCFKKVNQTGAASPLPANAPANDDWTVEAALDLDLASAACPSCKLVLVEAQDDSSDGLYIANNAAASLGAVVSNSWGAPEPSNTTSYETYFNHPGKAIFVAAGDDGYNDGGQGPDYPSTSAYTIAVGGTTLTKSTGTSRGWTEGAWSDGGSSCSTHIAKPSWQTSTACTKRMTSDVSAVGDPNTGLAVYNAASGGWIVVGGTSASSPFVAGLFARYNLNAKTAQYIYQNASKFYDVTTGTNGTCTTALCKSAAGWDGPTGIGTPNGVALAGGGTCTPACSGKTCGDDGCGGSCGTCGTGTTCQAGACVGTGSGSGSGSGGGSGGGGTGTCSHSECSTGAELGDTCDTCAGEVCAQDDYCCTTAWDSQCVGEVKTICNETCGTSSSCSHSICSAGTKLTKTCDSCASEICSQDSYCCGTKWDSQCVAEVGSICGESCN